MVLERLGRVRRRRKMARRLYAALVEQARAGGFYARLGVPDTVDGRFDVITLHAFLVFNRIKRGGGAERELGQALFDVMFADMDRSLREMGVGDLSVGSKVKQMVFAFYGRMAAYETALASDDGELREALLRNVYRGRSPGKLELAELGDYVRAKAEVLAAQDMSDIADGDIAFGDPPAAGNGGEGVIQEQ